MTKSLSQQYATIVDRYTKVFCAKHGFSREDGWWVADNKGGIYEIADHYFGFDDIRYDVDNELPDMMIFDWYDATLEYYYIDPDREINLKSWHKGLRYTDLPKAKESVLNRIKRAFKRILATDE